MSEKILIVGAGGQIGVELTLALRAKFGDDAVIASDIRPAHPLLQDKKFLILDVMDADAVRTVVQNEKITQIYLLAAILSATGEKNPLWAWDINMKSLLSILDICVQEKVSKLYWPSSIAVFGPTTPMDNTPQKTVIEPTTVYGISKYAGELWCQYYFDKYGLDVRSIRYPGLISWKSAAGGGTTDYAIDIYVEALKNGTYTCFLKEDTYLPMMYMDDAIRATIELMDAPKEAIKNRLSYNLGGISFAPKDIAAAIQEHIPDFEISYAPDFRQAIAESWPNSIDDTAAQQDWGWKHQFDLETMTIEMLKNLK